MKYPWNVARMRGKENATNLFDSKTWKKETIWETRHGWQDDIKVN
jgi:hypothetical protein